MLDNLTKLGSNTEYNDRYDPSLLELIERDVRRSAYKAPMLGIDIWTCFEVSFLLPNGLPDFLVLRISNLANSKYIFESKSLKLYLNSFNNTTFNSREDVVTVIEKDLTKIVESKVGVIEVVDFSTSLYEHATCLENMLECQKINITNYTYSPQVLRTFPNRISENVDLKLAVNRIKLYSNLLRSNCEITNQPDWGRVYIEYTPNNVLVDYPSLLEYIVSYRNHQEFHEPTCERIYNDLYELLQPKELTVICQYTRRGGIDINPIRSTDFDRVKQISCILPKLIQQ